MRITSTEKCEMFVAVNTSLAEFQLKMDNTSQAQKKKMIWIGSRSSSLPLYHGSTSMAFVLITPNCNG
jgi:hypothetical protein